MGWIGSWLKELIILILFASFVDLLLPNRSMQRYAKAAVGLLIVMVLLSPVFKLFHAEWDADSLIRSAEKLENGAAEGAAAAKAGTGASSLSSIMEEANRMKAYNAGRAQKLAETQLEASIRSDLEQNLPLAVRSVKASVKTDAGGNLKMTGVAVVIQPAASAAEQKEASVPAMKPVEPVESFQPIKPVKPAASRAAEGKQAAPAAEAPAGGVLREVVNRLRDYWQIPESAISAAYAK